MRYDLHKKIFIICLCAASIWVCLLYETVQGSDIYTRYQGQSKQVVVGFGKSIPIGKLARVYEAGMVQPSLGYRVGVGKFLMGLSGQFWLYEYRPYYKDYLFERDDFDKTNFSILSVTQEFFYHERLYHPTYVSFGFEWMYLVPLQQAGIPWKRNVQKELEIGSGLACVLSHGIDEWHWVHVKAHVWRGTKTTQWSGLGLALEFSRHLP